MPSWAGAFGAATVMESKFQPGYTRNRWTRGLPESEPVILATRVSPFQTYLVGASYSRTSKCLSTNVTIEVLTKVEVLLSFVVYQFRDAPIREIVAVLSARLLVFHRHKAVFESHVLVKPSMLTMLPLAS